MSKQNIPLEKTIVRNIAKYLRSLDECYHFKEHGGPYGTAGVPDIVVCYKGVFLGLEVKRPGNKPTVLQQGTLDKINAAGGCGVVVRSVEEVKRLIEIVDIKTS